MNKHPFNNDNTPLGLPHLAPGLLVGLEAVEQTPHSISDKITKRLLYRIYPFTTTVIISDYLIATGNPVDFEWKDFAEFPAVRGGELQAYRKEEVYGDRYGHPSEYVDSEEGITLGISSRWEVFGDVNAARWDASDPPADWPPGDYPDKLAMINHNLAAVFNTAFDGVVGDYNLPPTITSRTNGSATMHDFEIPEIPHTIPPKIPIVPGTGYMTPRRSTMDPITGDVFDNSGTTSGIRLDFPIETHGLETTRQTYWGLTGWTKTLERDNTLLQFIYEL